MERPDYETQLRDEFAKITLESLLTTTIDRFAALERANPGTDITGALSREFSTMPQTIWTFADTMMNAREKGQ